jgi:hypothetical protein
MKYDAGFLHKCCCIIVIWLIEWQSDFPYGQKWISICNFCRYWVICVKFTEDLHVMLLSCSTFYEYLVHWEPFFSQECKCKAILVFCIFHPIWIKFYIEDFHVTLLKQLRVLWKLVKWKACFIYGWKWNLGWILYLSLNVDNMV